MNSSITARRQRDGVRLACFISAILVPNCAYGKPAFGVVGGAPIRNLQVVRKIDATTFEVRPPQPNPTFTAYTVSATPKSGVCEVIAETADLGTDERAMQVFSNLNRALSASYGEPKTFFPDPTAYATIGLEAGNRGWWKPRALGIRSILLTNSGLGGQGEKRVRVVYTFPNFDACSNWAPGQSRSGL